MPALIAATPLPRPRTSTGTELSTPLGTLSVVAPSPSCPQRFLPQHLTAPESVKAQECSPPTLIAATALPGGPFLTPTGPGLLVLVLSPSCP